MTIRVNGTVVNSPASWEDLKFPLNLSRVGANSKPEYDLTNCGLLFPQNDATEIAYITDQTPHAMKRFSIWRPHIHWIQTSAAIPVFKIAYRLYDNGTAPGAFTTIATNSQIFNYVSGSIAQISRFPDIATAPLSGSSILFDIKLYRDDNVVTGDVLAKSFDIHCQIDSSGSDIEYSKSF
jgi:hypothetical protein